MNIAIITAKCNATRKLYGIRIEQNGNFIDCTDSFPLASSHADAKYPEFNFHGELRLTSDFEGCPHCHQIGFIKCGTCGKISCWDSITKKVTCPWCGVVVDIDMESRIDSVNGSQF